MATAMISACLGACLLVLMPPGADECQAGRVAPVDGADLSAGWR